MANAKSFEKLVAVNRVAKVVKGGRQFGFTALTVVGDGNGGVGYGYGKARELPLRSESNAGRAQAPDYREPEKDTLQYELSGSHGATRVFMQPASESTECHAGGGCGRGARVCWRAQRAREELRVAQPDQRRASDAERALANALPGADRGEARQDRRRKLELRTRYPDVAKAKAKAKEGHGKQRSSRCSGANSVALRVIAMLAGLGLRNRHRRVESRTRRNLGMIDKITLHAAGRGSA